MAIWVRNCQYPNPTVPQLATSSRCWFFREILLAFGFTENSNDGDAAWGSASNLLVSVAAGASGFAVDGTQPGVVTSPDPIFTSSHVDKVLNLLALNEQNRGLWRITAVVDAYTVLVDTAGLFGDGWVTESGIAARITTGTGTTFTDGAWTLLDAPTGTDFQIRVLYNNNDNIVVYVRPKGKLGDLTEITSVGFGAYYMVRSRINGYYDGVNGMVFTAHWSSNSATYSSSMFAFGKLLDAAPADTDPVFLLSNNNGMTSNSLQALSIRMLDSVLGQIEAYATWLKTQTGAATSLYNVFGRRVFAPSGVAAIRSPWVVLNDTASVGACVRGRLPMFRATYQGFEQWTPMDIAGTLQHYNNGIVIPRNGVDDPLIMWPQV